MKGSAYRDGGRPDIPRELTLRPHTETLFTAVFACAMFTFFGVATALALLGRGAPPAVAVEKLRAFLRAHGWSPDEASGEST